MKALVLYDFPPSPGGIATQADLLYRALLDLGVDAMPVHFESAQEKEWYYRWFEPDVVLGIGYWGHTPDLILHPQRYGARPVPWLNADGYIASFQEVLNALPLILTTSNWVKEVHIRDGINPDILEVVPVGCDIRTFIPRPMSDPKVRTVRESLGVAPDQLMLLTVGGNANSKGAPEVMQALSMIDTKAPDWKYVCKVWPQEHTAQENMENMRLATSLGIEKNVVFSTNVISRNFMPYLMAASDIYVAPSRQEGFGVPMVEAGACGKPVVSQKAMGMLDTLVHGETAFMADVAQEIKIGEATLGTDQGFEKEQHIVFNEPRTVEYRASVQDLAKYLLELMENPGLRVKMGKAGRKRAVNNFSYQMTSKKLLDVLSDRLGIS
jgi:starch synthase